ncbi:SIMPL domain-containing protein [Brevundimonas sp.]|uniref:SIMPL domain-containing protein n=1 Tax=Brevundimonas sp. TaxID=1871086 RepID=UPI002FC5DB06
MKRIGLVFLLLAAGCTQPPDPRGVRPDEVLLQVAATGRAEARPDEARLTVGVSTSAPSAAAASAGNNAAMARVSAALARLGVKPDDIQTRSVTLGRVDYGPGRGGYRAENMVEVRIRDVRQAGPAISAATEAGGNVVSGPDLQASDPERAKNAAYAAAYKAARARAEAYAAAAGLKVERVIAIRDGSGQPPVPWYVGDARNMAVAQSVAPAPPVHAGAGAYEVQVHADFALAR